MCLPFLTLLPFLIVFPSLLQYMKCASISHLSRARDTYRTYTCIICNGNKKQFIFVGGFLPLNLHLQCNTSFSFFSLLLFCSPVFRLHSHSIRMCAAANKLFSILPHEFQLPPSFTFSYALTPLLVPSLYIKLPQKITTTNVIHYSYTHPHTFTNTLIIELRHWQKKYLCEITNRLTLLSFSLPFIHFLHPFMWYNLKHKSTYTYERLIKMIKKEISKTEKWCGGAENVMLKISLLSTKAQAPKNLVFSNDIIRWHLPFFVHINIYYVAFLITCFFIGPKFQGGWGFHKYVLNRFEFFFWHTVILLINILIFLQLSLFEINTVFRNSSLRTQRVYL